MAVFTPVSKVEIEDFLVSHYLLDELKAFEGIVEGVENTNYIIYLGKDKNPYILTIFERRVNPRDLPFFMDLTDWLSARGIPCPRPVHGINNQTVYPLKGKSAAIVEFLSGKNKPQITPQHLTLLGDLLARMHLAADGFPNTRRNVLTLTGWQSLFNRFRERADEIMPGLAQDLAAELAYLDKNWPVDLPSGIVHTDLFPDNVFFTEEKGLQLSGVIDFYFSCNDFLAYDFTIALNAWCFDAEHRFVPERAKALFAAYSNVRPFTKAELTSLPLLARGAAMRFIVTRSLDWLNHVEGTQVVPKNPMEYIEKLRFHRSIRTIADYKL
jgi:homoserine kinase type II